MHDGHQVLDHFLLWRQTLVVQHNDTAPVRRAVMLEPLVAEPHQTVFVRENKATTASWSDDKKSYFLAAVGDQALLQKYIQ